MAEKKGFWKKLDDLLKDQCKELRDILEELFSPYKNLTSFEEEKRKNTSVLESDMDNVDKGIKDLVLKINKLPFLYTSCSCEGHLGYLGGISGGTPSEEIEFNPPINSRYGSLDFSLKRKSKEAHWFIRDVKKFILEFTPLNEEPKLSKVASSPALEYRNIMKYAKEFKKYREEHNEEISRYVPHLYNNKYWGNWSEINGEYRVGLENWTSTKSSEKTQNIEKNFARFWNGLESLVDKYFEQK